MKTTDEIDRIYKGLMPELKKLILSGDVKPTLRPVMDAIAMITQERYAKLKLGRKSYSKPDLQKVGNMILEQMEREDVIRLNPAGGVGRAKYILNKGNNQLPDFTQLV